MNTDSDQYFDLKSLSGYCSLAVPTLRDYLHEGMPHFKLKGKILVRRSEFDRWMQQFRVDQSRLDVMVENAMEALKK